MARQPAPRPAFLRYTVSLDVPTLSDQDLVTQAAELSELPRLVGRTVEVWVGSERPAIRDPRAAYFLAEALRAGVAIELVGSASAISAWGQDIRSHLEATRLKRRNRLEVVR